MAERKLNTPGEFEKPTWDWTPVECILKTTEHNRKSVQWQLAPSILLTNPASSNSDPHVRLFIDTEKSLSYAPDLGWNWHKSWNLPNISIRLEIKDEATGELLLTPKNIYAQIFAVKKNGENQRSEKVTLLDVGIRGQSKVEMVDGQVYFSAMKFSSTTYNNQGQNFHLLIVIYIQENQTQKPKVLTAVISPEIFVDSRRSARDYQEKKFNSFVEPFSIDQLEKQFIKRENKSRTEQEIEIKNDPEGFYNYLTAPNIRHKVKHPVFLAIRFSNCVTILYNEKRLSQIYNAEREPGVLASREVIEMLQKKLLKESQTKTVRQDISATSIPEKLFLFVVKNVSDSLKRKKVMESIETLDSQSFGVVQDQNDIPPEFKNFADFGPLSTIYKDNFDLLRELCRRYVPSDEESSGSDSEQKFGKDEDLRKIKVNKIESGNNLNQVNASTISRRSNSRPANIICETIHTSDSKANVAINKQNQQSRSSRNQKKNEQSKTNDKLIKKEQSQKEIIYPPHDGMGFIPVSSLNSADSQNPQNSFSLNIISKKGSAFNNLRSMQSDKPESANNLNDQFNQNQNVGFTGFSQNQNNAFGMPTMGMNGLNQAYGLGAMGQGVNLNMANMANMQNMQNMPTMPNMQGMQGMQGIQGMQGMPNMQGMNGLHPMPGMQGIQGIQGLGAMNGMPGMNMGMPNLGRMGGVGLGGIPGMGGQNFPNMGSSAALTNLLGNGSSFQNFPNQSQPGLSQTENMNNQVKSLQNLLCSNFLLTNWLNSVKSSNMNLFDSMKPTKEDGQPKNPSQGNMGQDNLANDMSRLPPQIQEQQSMICLLQQINLYRELLAQVTYQNQLLGRNMGSGHTLNPNPTPNELQELMQQGERGMGFRGFQPAQKGSGGSQPKEEHQE